MWEFCILCCGCLLIPLYIFAALLVPAGLALGIINLHNCPIDPHLPLWLIYFNGFVFVRAIISCCVSCCCDKDGWCAAFIKNVVFIGDIVLMILGALYLFPLINSVNFEDSADLKHFCNKPTYIVAFIEIAWAWLYLFVVIAICGCTVCLLLIGGSTPPVGEGATSDGAKHYQFMGYVTATAPGVDLAHKFIGRGERSGDIEMR
uniref:Transmembrane protein n=1 Tax=Acrobeloides nanus TaxID=290746 RepID=A0A914DY16_9BILA